MDNFIVVSLFANLFLIVQIIFHWTGKKAAVYELERLERKVLELRNNTYAWEQAYARLERDKTKVITQTSTQGTTKLLVDQQTYSLVKLASSNPNENEARNAALKAIQRLSSYIGKK